MWKFEVFIFKNEVENRFITFSGLLVLIPVSNRRIHQYLWQYQKFLNLHYEIIILSLFIPMTGFRRSMSPPKMSMTNSEDWRDEFARLRDDGIDKSPLPNFNKNRKKNPIWFYRMLWPDFNRRLGKTQLTGMISIRLWKSSQTVKLFWIPMSHQWF